MKTNYVLIDFENVQVKSLALLEDEHFRVYVFLGPQNAKVPVEIVFAMHEMAPRAQYIRLDAPGKNALDFHIAYQLGVLSKLDPAGFFHVISKDTGFDPLLHYLKKHKIQASRSASIEEMPCFAASTDSSASDAAATSVGTAITAESNESTLEASAAPSEILVEAALADLIRRKTTRPKAYKTLLSTIHAACGKDLPKAQIQSVYQTLVKRGHVTLNGTRVVYSLPA